MPDILPVSLQNFLYSRKSELRKNEIRLFNKRYAETDSESDTGVMPEFYFESV